MRTALVVVDVLADFRHEDGDRLAESFRRVCRRLVEVFEYARRSAVAVSYANDPAGRWNESREEAVARARMGAVGDLPPSLRWPRARVGVELSARWW